MVLPSTLFGHVASHCNHMDSSPDENNNIKKVYRSLLILISLFIEKAYRGSLFYFQK